MGSPIGPLSSKRGDSFRTETYTSTLDVPLSSKKSTSYTNMVVSNVRPANPSSPMSLAPGGYTASTSTYGALGGGLGSSGLGSMGMGNFNFGFPSSSTNVTTSTMKGT